MEDDARDHPGTGVRVRRLRGAEELEAALVLRVRVFCGEQGVSLAAERDGRDGEASHLGAFGADGTLIGTCRLLDGDGAELVVQRVAVRADRRGRGVGRALMDAAGIEARRRGAHALALHAQLESEAFYARLGFVRVGRAFMEEGIAHVSMRRELALS
ncbi:MAG: GNAT family N-acetyltransferase [Actinobacteria bacterium]|nr:GNAT family N-acetyltransferase [Actinomycetota bacterium]